MQYMKKHLASLMIIIMLNIADRAHAQMLVLYVTPGDTLFVSVADTLHTFGLGLTPDVRLDLSGISIYRTTTLTNNSLSPAINRAFKFTPSAPSFSGIYKFWYTNSELNGINKSDLELFYYTPNWSTAPKASHDTITNVMTSQSVVINPKELTLAPLSPLPLSLLQVAANLKGNNSSVTWKTEAESDLEGYTVLHSMNGNNWSAIGTATPKMNRENNYEFLHINPPAGRNYYIIKARGLSGATKYSKVVYVNINMNSQLDVYPNPANNKQNATLLLEKPSLIQIKRINGTLVSATYYTAGTHTISTNGLIPGVYLISDGQKVIQWVIQ